METRPELSADQIRQRLRWADGELLRECELHIHRTGGPGGQHRNKVATAIRVIHKPTGIVATAGETRSQHENKAAALARLREAIAVEIRLPPPELPASGGASVVWPDSVQVRGGHLRVNPTNVGYAETLAIALDAAIGHIDKPAVAAASLGVSTSSMTRFIADHSKAWTQWMQLRKAAGLPALRA
ncbi:MAG: peptide chain release factor family protein [Phycisphaerae bacterium]